MPTDPTAMRSSRSGSDVGTAALADADDAWPCRAHGATRTDTVASMA